MTALPIWKRALLWFFRIVIGLGIVFIPLMLAVWAYPPLIILASPGRVSSAYCSPWKAFFESKVLLDQEKREERIREASRIIRRDGELELWETPHGRFWIPASKEESVLHLLLAQQERDIYGDRQLGVRRGDVVFDLGAHVGTYIRKALDLGASKIIAVEPTPEVIRCIHLNFPSEIAAGRVVVVPKGIWDKEELLDLFSGGASGSGNTFVNESGGGAVVSAHAIPVTSIDKLVEELKLDKVDFIKADIKGSTIRMLKGATGSIRRFQPRMAISTEEPPEDPKAIYDALLALAPGYKLICGPCLLRADEIRNDVIFFHP